MAQALPSLMPGFDKEIAKLAQRVLINPRNIDYHTGVLATKVTPGKPGCGTATTPLATTPANQSSTACICPLRQQLSMSCLTLLCPIALSANR